ncbi:hypothetical protein NDU88_005558 [Pleurodeles waltl]|uniref:Uncharacterized protein n=1 Tax=Pleurodeles waltl TaxID=8319 RepID=A0AAV7TD10_PLEWA|nr:hypothetical protein NDU88_005558 [Pleurodeles waltl]
MRAHAQHSLLAPESGTGVFYEASPVDISVLRDPEYRLISLTHTRVTVLIRNNDVLDTRWTSEKFFSWILVRC